MTLREEIAQGENVALEYMKEVEGWGGGVSRYFESCERMGIPLPIVEEAAGCVKVVFRRRIAANGGNGGNHDTNLDTNDTNYDTNDTNAGTNLGERILALMLEDSKATVDQLARICKVSRPTLNRAIKMLKATGRIRRDGGTRGSWVVLHA